MDLDPVYKDEEGLPLLRLTFDWHDNDRAQYRYMAARAAEVVRATNPGEMKVKDALEPFDVKHYKTTHITGGAIMGSDPGHSVCTTYGQVWDTPNVFVTGAALYPQNSAYNPTGTLGALAYRTAEAIGRRYFRHPGQLMDVT
jgi:gluconate 2-dehydrogenase alpha chain